MDPTTLAALLAPQIILGIAQAYNTAQANGANQVVLDQLKAQYENLLPPNFNMSITTPPQLMTQALASPAFQMSVASPAYDTSKLQPQNLAVVGQLAPQLIPVIKEAASQTISNQSPDQLSGRNAQLEALQKFAQVGAGGFDPAYAQKVQQAAQAAQQEAQGRQGALMDSFARRGLSGSGLELAANMSGNAQTMNNLAAQNQGAAAQSYQNQLAALAQGAGIGANLQNADTSLQARNADIINSFNQRTAANAQGIAGQNAGIANQAQAGNLQNAQNIANQNVGINNQNAQQQQSRQDQIAQQLYQSALANAQLNNQGLQQGYQNNVGQQNSINANNQWLANFQRQGINDQNSNLANMYNANLGKLNGLRNLATGQMNQNIDAAKSGNAGISSLGDLGSIASYGYSKMPKTSNGTTNTNAGDFSSPQVNNDIFSNPYGKSSTIQYPV